MTDATLTHKQQLFIEHYLGAARGNATEAARLAGYAGNDDTLAHAGHGNLAHPEIAARVKRKVDAVGLTKDAILDALASIVAIPNEQFFGAGRDSKVSLGDKVRALELLGKYHRLWVERQETEHVERIVVRTMTAVDPFLTPPPSRHLDTPPESEG